ncbi:nuclear transport factor 2 family protein [Sphingobium sp. B11D3D]|uniref:nuclear transport factor 2 family protein n=1 Tax=Sphingobium sp. B11D3D TaxID=2940576 RepID=UPI0022242EA9|nr:nuclear transport factor 2 family protein [Sphingobium sp. B11D3D]MCW2370506.1 ketosteroid isomerase-like protein [Sphingobium sp. B11D3D]
MRIVRASRSRWVCIAAACAVLSPMPAMTEQAARAKPSVIYTGKMEARGTTRAQYQRLILDLAHVWADCDADLMRRILTDDVDFSYPGRRLIGRDAALADLEGFCKVATDRSIYFPADAFYIDVRNGRVAAEVQFRVTQNGEKQVVNDVWIATVREGRIAIIKEYLDGRVRLLQAEGKLTYGEDAPFLTPWPPRVEQPPTP